MVATYREVYDRQLAASCRKSGGGAGCGPR